MTYGAPPIAGNVVAYLTLKLHADGAMSIEGNVGDSKMCRNMLDAAHHALRAKWADKDGAPKPLTAMVTDTGITP